MTLSGMVSSIARTNPNLDKGHTVFRLFGHGHEQFAQLLFNLLWAVDGLSDLLAEHLAPPLTEAVHRHLQRAFGHAQFLGKLPVGHAAVAAQMTLHAVEQLGLARLREL